MTVVHVCILVGALELLQSCNVLLEQVFKSLEVSFPCMHTLQNFMHNH